MTKALVTVTEEKIKDTIIVLRGKRIIIDSDLAEFYGISTKVLNQAIKRNIDRFPDDFMFQLNEKEKNYVVTNCDHLSKLRFSRFLPYAFTEYGTVMAANMLNSPVAVQASIRVVQVFVRIREFLATHKELAAKIEELENKLGNRLDKHDKEIQVLFEAMRQLMNPPNPRRKKIGFEIGKK